MKPRAWTVALALALIGAAAPEPEGFRIESYRAPTPATLHGATVLTTAQAEALWRDKRAAFVDVLPQAPRPKNLPKDVLWRDKPRADIPGSVWLPDTGYGALSDPMRDYLVAGLKKARAGDPERPLVIYCQRDCWMSWNAAKRALALGFKPVDWYPEGTDGWREAGLPLEARQPEPRP
jgi:PQQ-dependent catabolism-associated CXXCW motif protein